MEARTLGARAEITIGVVILTWNGKDDTLACLASLEHSSQELSHVIVVDNGSTDGTVEAIRALPSTPTLIENGANLGFAAGNNVGIEYALAHGVDAVLLLNNDTAVDPLAIERLADALGSDSSVGACSPVIHYAERPDRLWFAGSPFDPSKGRAGRLSPAERGREPLPKVPIRIDRVVGAAMLVRREAIEEVGLLADELFYLYEDVDWSLRMRQAKWALLLVPEARVSHVVAGSQGGRPVTPTTAYYGTRNDLEVCRRYAALSRSAAARRELACVMVHLAGVRRSRSGDRLAALRATLAGWSDFRSGRLGARRGRKT